MIQIRAERLSTDCLQRFNVSADDKSSKESVDVVLVSVNSLHFIIDSVCLYFVVTFLEACVSNDIGDSPLIRYILSACDFM